MAILLRRLTTSYGFNGVVHMWISSYLWRSVNDLMGRGSTPASSTIAADDFHRFMDDKVAGVRASTDGAPPPQYATAPPDCALHDFTQLTTDVLSRLSVNCLTSSLRPTRYRLAC